MVLFAITGTSIKDKYPTRMMLCYSNLELIGSSLIGSDICLRVLLKIVCGPFLFFLSSLVPVTGSRWRAHCKVVEFQTSSRGHPDPRLWPLKFIAM